MHVVPRTILSLSTQFPDKKKLGTKKFLTYILETMELLWSTEIY
jgi:hypothetical protein